jgi:hypothetical protein
MGTRSVTAGAFGRLFFSEHHMAKKPMKPGKGGGKKCVEKDFGFGDSGSLVVEGWRD